MVNTSPTSEPERIIPPRKPRTLRDNLLTGLMWLVAIAFLAYLVASFKQTDFNLYKLYTGAPDIQRVLSDLAHPDLSWYEYELESVPMVDAQGNPVLNSEGNQRTRLKPRLDSGGNQVIRRNRKGKPKLGTLPRLLVAMNETVMIALVGTLLAVLLSFPLAFFAARNLTHGSATGRTLYYATRALFNLLRAFPQIVLAIIFVFMVGVGPFPGVLAIALHGIGMLGKLFSETIETVDQAPVEAVRATGASNFLVVWFGILPQVLPQFLSFSLYRWDIDIRSSIILGIVGAGGIGFMLEQYIRMFQYDKTSTAFLIILVAVTILDWASGYFREKLG